MLVAEDEETDMSERKLATNEQVLGLECPYQVF